MLIDCAPWRVHAQGRPDQRVAGILLRSATVALVAFHVWLLRAHLVSGQFLEPAVAARWIGAVLILVAFCALHRRGVPLLWGRRAIVLWLLVILLHVSASRPSSIQIRDALALPAAAATTALPTGLLPLLTGLGLALLAARRRREAGALGAIRAAPAGIAPVPSTRTGAVVELSSRPPPA
jgi:hypothetical protein